MKTLLLSLALLVSFTAFGQSETPFKKANTIEVHTSLTPEQAYKQLAAALQENGYGIASSDATLGSISTASKPFKNIQTKLTTLVKGDSTAVIVLKGDFAMSGMTATGIEHRGMKDSPFMRAWQQMEQVAKTLPATKVLYR